ncbi:MAG: NADPH-dependent FMN reductase [Rhodobacterales bacterium]|nr:MAG: NADPH-dependent FMN reductase [Rhodobacterales bacterium]
MTQLLGISGALRAASTNSMLIREAARLFAPDEFIEADLRLPLYDGDLEADGIPAEVQTLADQIARADAIVISTPEYNKAPSGVLKNALDWVSRTEGSPWQDKPVAIMSSAAGRAGGERTQFALRLMLVPFRARVLAGPEVMVAGAGRAFGEDGQLTDESALKLLAAQMKALRAEIRT